MGMRSLRPLWLLCGLAPLWAACPGNTTIGTGTGGSTVPPRGDEPRERPAPPEWVETICNRVEDCAVERNVRLARDFGGNPADVAAAKREARQALVSGAVRRWCLLRIKRLRVPQVQRIHGCLKRLSCTPFYRCANFPGAHARSRRPPPRAASR